LGSLTAEASDPVTVALAWVVTGSGGGDVLLSRDGEPLATVPSGTTTYTDSTVRPENHYAYAANVDGAPADAAVTAEVETPPLPPLSKARIGDNFDVTVTFVVVDYVGRKPGDKEGARWVFEPKCATGPCTTKVDMLMRGTSSTVTLRYQDGEHRGTGTVYAGVRCAGDKERIQSTITVAVHATKAKYLYGDWRATQIAGTYESDDAATSQCSASITKATVKGVRVGL
jgi:hypothetical protein